MPKLTFICIVLWIASLTGCGTEPKGPDGARESGAAPASPSDPGSPLALPRGVPLKPTGSAVAEQAKVVRAWAAALRAGDIEGASALWAVPSKVQNGTPVVALSTRGQVRGFNAALPCGSVVTSAGGAKGDFTIATVRLTERKGARCDAADGAVARTAIRVLDGKIVEWYRLPDDPDARRPTPPPDAVDSTTI
ncbi:MAG: hypothetical protein ACR2LK_16785 [Solirubrobacteraceae bacterium]